MCEGWVTTLVNSLSWPTETLSVSVLLSQPYKGVSLLDLTAQRIHADGALNIVHHGRAVPGCRDELRSFCQPISSYHNIAVISE